MKRRVHTKSPKTRAAATVRRLRRRIKQARSEISGLLNELDRAYELLTRDRPGIR